jgi:hypothetical protein
MTSFDSTKDVQHKPLLNLTKLLPALIVRESVLIKYVCTSSLDGHTPYDIFYRGTPHLVFGNRYFGLNGECIINADLVESLPFLCIKEDDKYYYSRYRHDFLQVNSSFIDGGRDYVRTNSDTYPFVVHNGMFIPRTSQVV